MGKDEINIAHLIGALRVGGAENQVVSLVNQLDPKLFNKHVIVFNDIKDGFRELLCKDIQYYSISYRYRNMLFGAIRLIRFLRMNKIDILHCHMYHACILGSICRIGIPELVILTTEHGKNPWKKWYHHLVEKKIINRSVSMRVAVSQDIKELRIKHDGVKSEDIIVIPNGVAISTYKLDIATRQKIIGSLGRLVDAKDYPTLFKAVKLVLESGYEIELRIAGEGNEKNKLQKNIQDLKLTENIKLLGFVKSDLFLKQINIFVMSSKREGIPVALLESMVRGIPVATTAVGGIPDVIEDGKEGLLSEPHNPQALANNIICLIEDKELRSRLSRNAREKIIRKYSIEGIATLYEELYKKLLAERNRKL